MHAAKLVDRPLCLSVLTCAGCPVRSNTLVNYPNAFNRAKKVGGWQAYLRCSGSS
jgi:hypothetical protein